MPVPKPTDPKAAHPPATGSKPDRKPWKKKTPVEVVLEQADKLKAEIAETEEELKAKRKQLRSSKKPRRSSKAMLEP